MYCFNKIWNTNKNISRNEILNIIDKYCKRYYETEYNNTKRSELKNIQLKQIL